MIITTTNHVEGREIDVYLDVISTQSVQGINVLRDIFTQFRDFFGGRSKTLEAALRDARFQATQELKDRGRRISADAIIGINYEVAIPSGAGGMLAVFVTGTAVKFK